MRNLTRKYISFVLSLAMILGSCLPAMATDVIDVSTFEQLQTEVTKGQLGKNFRITTSLTATSEIGTAGGDNWIVYSDASNRTITAKNSTINGITVSTANFGISGVNFSGFGTTFTNTTWGRKLILRGNTDVPVTIQGTTAVANSGSLCLYSSGDSTITGLVNIEGAVTGTGVIMVSYSDDVNTLGTTATIKGNVSQSAIFVRSDAILNLGANGSNYKYTISGQSDGVRNDGVLNVYAKDGADATTFTKIIKIKDADEPTGTTNIKAGSVTVNGAVTQKSVTVSGNATLNLTAGNTFTVTDGITNLGSLNFTGAGASTNYTIGVAVKSDTGITAGTTTLAKGTYSISFTNFAQNAVAVASDATLNVNFGLADKTVSIANFENAGTLNITAKTGGTSITSIGGYNSTNGSTELTSGILSVSGDVTQSSFTVADGATLTMDSTSSAITLTTTNALDNKGTLKFLGSNGTTVSSAITDSSGTKTGAIVVGDGTNSATATLNGNVTQNSITVNEKATLNLTAGNFTVSSGIANSGNFNITKRASGTDAVELSSNITGTGTTKIADVVKISDGGKTITQGALEIDGTGASLTTNADKLIITSGESAGTITNKVANGLVLTGGTLQESISGSGSTSITGDVEVQGTLGQNVNVASSKTLTINGATLDAEKIISGAGTLTLSSDFTAGVTQLTITGGITNASKNFTLTGTGSLASNITGSGTTIINGEVTSAKTIANAVTINAEKKLTSTGTISAVVTNNGTLEVNGGTVTGDITNNLAGATLTISGGTVTKVTNTLGTVTLTSGTIGGALSNAEGQTVNLNGGTVTGNITNNGTVTVANGATVTLASVTGTGTLTNSGTLNLGTNTVQTKSSITTFVNNSALNIYAKAGDDKTTFGSLSGAGGTTEIKSGTLEVTGDVTQNSITVAENATLNFTGDSTLNVSSFTGSGTFAVTKEGTIRPTFTNGTASMSLPNLTLAGTLDMNDKGQDGSTRDARTLNLTGSGNFTASGSLMINTNLDKEGGSTGDTVTLSGFTSVSGDLRVQIAYDPLYTGSSLQSSGNGYAFLTGANALSSATGVAYNYKGKLYIPTVEKKGSDWYITALKETSHYYYLDGTVTQSPAYGVVKVDGKFYKIVTGGTSENPTAWGLVGKRWSNNTGTNAYYIWDNASKKLTQTGATAANRDVLVVYDNSKPATERQTGLSGDVTYTVFSGLNSTLYDGGAIKSDTNITSIKADFLDNYVNATGSYTLYGGAIYNTATIGTNTTGITGDFVANYAKSENNMAYGGAIYNGSGGTITSITGDFLGNYASAYTKARGGAIDNESGTIGTLTGDFIGNYSSGSNAYGGAINNAGGTISSVTGNFLGNYASATNSAFGGAIYNEGTITILAGDRDVTFSGNTVTGSSPRGGAIYNTTNATLNLRASEGYFITFVGDNSVTTTDSVYNLGTMNVNSNEADKGTVSFKNIAGTGTLNILNGTVNINGTVSQNTIKNNANLNLTTSDSSYDWAIKTTADTGKGTTTFSTTNANGTTFAIKNEFTQNKVILAGSKVTLDVDYGQSGKTISIANFENAGTLNLSNSATNGTVNLTATVTKGTSETNGKLNLNSDTTIGASISGQNIKVAEGKALTVNDSSYGLGDTNDLTMGSGSTLDMRGATASINTITVGNFTANGTINFDVNIADDETGMGTDTIATTKATGTLTLGSVNILGSSTDETTWALGTKRTLTLLTATDITSDLVINNASQVTTATSSGRLYQITAAVDQQSEKVFGKVDITKSGYNGTLEKIVQAITVDNYNLGNISTYSMLDNVTITEDLGTLTRVDKTEESPGVTPRDFTINGKGDGTNVRTIYANGKAGVTINSGDSLTVNSATISGFSKFATNGGTMTLNGVTFTDNTTGTADIENNATLNLSGNATTFVKGISGSGTTNVNVDTNMGSVTLAQTTVVVASEKTLTINAGSLQANVTNNGTVALGAGTLGEGYTITDGAITIGGNVSASVADLASSKGIANASSTLTLTGSGELKDDITGGGKTIISGQVTTTTDEKTITQNSLEISGDGASLTTNADKLTISGGITNSVAGGLVLNGGTLEENISGSGSTSITGNVEVQGTLGQDVTVSSGKVLTIGSGASLGESKTISGEGALTLGIDFSAAVTQLALTGGITNESNTLTLSGSGNLASNITGSGTTVIAGTVTSEKTIANAVTVKEDASLTNSGTISGTVTINAKGSTEGSIAGSLTNTGTISGAVTNDGTLETTANGITKGVTNNATLKLTGGDLASAISGADGSTTITGAVTIADDKTYSITQKSLTISSGSLTTNADKLTVSGGITNNVSDGLVLTGGTLGESISGTGTTSITGNVEAQGTLGQDVTVSSGKALTIGSGASLGEGKTISGEGALTLGTDFSAAVSQLTLTGGITNASNTLTLSGSGNLASAISGENGSTTITGAVTNDNGNTITQKSLTISSGSLTTNANSLTISNNTITNNATNGLVLTGGTLQESISGSGSTSITGNVEVQGTLGQNVTVSSGKVLTIGSGASLGDGKTISGEGALTLGIDFSAAVTQLTLTGGITNESNTLTLSGTGNLASNITGSGTTVINGTVTSEKSIANAVTNSGTFTTTANGITGGVTNNSTLTLTGGNLASNISGADGSTTITGAVTNTDGNTITQKSLEISGASASLTTDASKIEITDGVTNNATLTLTGGKLASNINSTNGTTIINGTVTSEKTIANAVTVNEDAKLTNSGTISGAVTINAQDTGTEAGSLTNTGTISGAVTNKGTLTSSASSITNTVTNDGTWDTTKIESDIISHEINATDSSHKGTLNINSASMDLAASIKNQNIVIAWNDEANNKKGQLLVDTATKSAYLDTTDNLTLSAGGVLNSRSSSDTVVTKDITVGNFVGNGGEWIFDAKYTSPTNDQTEGTLEMDTITATNVSGNIKIGAVKFETPDDTSEWIIGTSLEFEAFKGTIDNEFTIEGNTTVTSGLKYNFAQGTNGKGYIKVTKDSFTGTLMNIVRNDKIDDYYAGNVNTYQLSKDLTGQSTDGSIGTLKRVDENTPRAFTIEGGNHKITATAAGDSGITVTNSGDSVTLKNLTMENYGTALNLASGTTGTLINVKFTGTTGDVANVVNNGTLNLNGTASTFDKGIKDTAGTGAAGETNVNVSTTLDDGVYIYQKNINIASNVALSVQANLIKGQVTSQNGGEVILREGTLALGSGNTISGGKITISGNVTANVADLASSQGIANASSKLTLTGSGSLADDITGSGTTVIDGTVSSEKSIENAVTINASKKLTSTGTISGAVANSGTFEVSGGTVSGGIDNKANATVMLTGGEVKTGAVTNAGTFNVTGGTLNVATTNTNAMNVSGGTVLGEITNNLASATLTISGGTVGAVTNTKGTVILNGGTISGAVINNGTFDIYAKAEEANKTTFAGLSGDNGLTEVKSGIVEVTGDLTQKKVTNAGTLTLTGGSVSVTDTTDGLNNTGTLKLGSDSGTGVTAIITGGAGTLEVIAGKVATINGSVTQSTVTVGTGSSLTFTGGATEISKRTIKASTFTNSGTLDFNSGFASVTNGITNTSALKFTGGSTTTVTGDVTNGAFANDGTMTVGTDSTDTATVTIEGSVTQGSVTVNEGSTLTLTGSTVNATHNNVSNSGILKLGNTTVKGTAITGVNGALEILQGKTATIEGDVTQSTLTVNTNATLNLGTSATPSQTTISGAVANSGTLNIYAKAEEANKTTFASLSGDNGRAEVKSGIVEVTGDVSQASLTNKGTLTLSGSEVNVATFTNESTLKLGDTTVKHGVTGTSGKVSVDDNHTAKIEGAVTQGEIDITDGSKLTLADATSQANAVTVTKVNNSGTLEIDKSSTVEFGEIIGGSSTGKLNIKNGTVAVSGNLKQAEVAMTSGTNLNLTGTSALTVSKFTGAGNVTVADGATVSGDFVAEETGTDITFTNNNIYQGNLSKDADATLNFINNGTWYPVFDDNNTSTNSATKISLNEGATLNMNDITWDGVSIPTRAFRTLNISGDVYSDNSTFMINTDLANSHGDTINFTDTASGTANLFVAYDPFYGAAKEGQRVGGAHTFLTGASGLTITAQQTKWNQDDGTALTFTPVVEQEGDNWKITEINTGATGASEETKAVADSAVSIGMTFLQNVNNLQKRLGDLRDGEASDMGWARFQRSNDDLKNGRGTSLSGNLYQIGYDFLVDSDKTAKSYFGLSLDVFDGSQSMKMGSGEVQSTTVSAYYTKIFESGHYFDFIARYGKYDSDTKVYDTSVANPKLLELDYAMNGFTMSGEYGYRWKLGKSGLYIEPQAEVIYGYVSGAKTTSNQNTEADIDSTRYFVTRAGLALGQKLKNFNYFLRASYYHDFAGSTLVKFGETSYKQDGAKNWWELSLGGGWQMGDASYFYAELVKHFKDLSNSVNFNLGFRFTM